VSLPIYTATPEANLLLSLSDHLSPESVAKYALSLDKSDYLPGELATMTVLLTDSLGLPVADGGTLTTTSVTSSFALAGGTLPTTSIVAAAGDLGKYSVKFNMPVNPGQQTFTVTLPATSTVTGNGSVTVTVSPDATSQAAADAAAEATDAANAATDAANAAAEAADAATAAAQDASDAVAALSTQVTTMIDALKKQITALTNLVIKIQKKVKA
jgi:methyl-accepting chemotaxis protein